MIAGRLVDVRALRLGVDSIAEDVAARAGVGLDVARDAVEEGLRTGEAFAVLGALVAVQSPGIELNTYAQIGLVMLVGLAAKNAIMITEFAAERYRHGESALDAAVHSSMLRLRPILMTSFAFILGILPLVVATGAGAQSRRSIGTVVLGGMLGAVVVDQIVVPTLFVMIMGIRERLFGRPRPAPGAESAPTGH